MVTSNQNHSFYYNYLLGDRYITSSSNWDVRSLKNIFVVNLIYVHYRYFIVYYDKNLLQNLSSRISQQQ